ncbi:hypothetical protein SRIMM317S_01026 [Streptomyces rimosus subsp. rimosus]
MSKVRPEPAPIAWMIAPHSAFLSMSETDAFCTFKILPRIGSSAWNSELRASFAVPSAESPSTMNSSLRSTSSLRQSASFAGSEDDSQGGLAALGLLPAGGPRYGSATATTLSSTARACCLASRLVEVKNALSSLAMTWATMREAAEVPSTSLVCPSNCGSARRTVTTAVRPSMASSLTTSSSATRSSLAARSASLTVLVTARSKPVTWVPPLGVAMMLTKERTVVS